MGDDGGTRVTRTPHACIHTKKPRCPRRLRQVSRKHVLPAFRGAGARRRPLPRQFAARRFPSRAGCAQRRLRAAKRARAHPAAGACIRPECCGEPSGARWAPTTKLHPQRAPPAAVLRRRPRRRACSTPRRAPPRRRPRLRRCVRCGGAHAAPLRRRAPAPGAQQRADVACGAVSQIVTHGHGEAQKRGSHDGARGHGQLGRRMSASGLIHALDFNVSHGLTTAGAPAPRAARCGAINPRSGMRGQAHPPRTPPRHLGARRARRGCEPHTPAERARGTVSARTHARTAALHCPCCAACVAGADPAYPAARAQRRRRC